jgi:predicted aspartyl protease
VVSVRAEVPLEIEPDSDTPGCATIRVKGVAGSRKLSFVLDSGARQTQIVDGAATVSNRKIDPRESRTVFTASPSETGELAELSVAGVRRTGMPVSIAPQRSRTENLLGVDFLDGHAWRLSLTSEMLASVYPGADDLGWIMERGQHGHFCVQVRWDAISANAVWDTGAGITVVDQGFAAEHPDLFVINGRSTASDGISVQETDIASMRGPSIELLKFRDSPAAIVDLRALNAGDDLPVDLILGYPLISQADWIIDLRLNRWSALMRQSDAAENQPGVPGPTAAI